MSQYLAMYLNAGEYAGTRIVSDSGIAEMQRLSDVSFTEGDRIVRLSYGMGWATGDIGGIPAIYHTGGSPQFSSWMVIDTETLNLPAQPTTFVGRKPRILELQALLTDVHLLTLTGPGGVGKTRLALEVAGSLIDHYPDGVWFVNLAPLGDEHLVPQAVVSTLGIPHMPGES